MWVKLAHLRTLLSSDYSRSTENKLRALIRDCVPAFTPELLTVNMQAPSLHMEFLREALLFGDVRYFRRAIQFGERHASFPLLYSWSGLSSNLRKYVLFCFCHHQPHRPTRRARVSVHLFTPRHLPPKDAATRVTQPDTPRDGPCARAY